MGGLFLIHEDGTLIEMNEKDYLNEAKLQELLEKYPNLISGDLIDDENPRKWLLICREMPVPDREDGAGRWSLDHLLLDQDGIPTLVEVKRSTDTRIRREVVGQMLDYAANALAYWPVEKIKAEFERNYPDPDSTLLEFLSESINTDEFWQKVKTNLQAGKMRLLFVADSIPIELKRIIEFLNNHLDPVEVLGFEIKKYEGHGLKTLVPRIIGQTQEAKTKKKPGGRQENQWDKDKFIEDLRMRHGEDAVTVANNLLDWAKKKELRLWWGKGMKDGSFFVMFDYRNNQYWTFSVWTYGRIEIQFQNIKNRQPFDDINKRKELLEKLNQIDGVHFPIDVITKRPTIKLSLLQDPDIFNAFIRIMDWYMEEIKQLNI
jgi:hypothetical protein